MDFLTKVEQNRAATAAACDALKARNLIVRWPITRKTDQGERKVEGLFRVDEAALNALDDEAFLSLRHSGALPTAYAQLLSMQQVRVLELAMTRAQRTKQQLQLGQELDLSWLEGDGIKFDFGNPQ
ncbi:MAG: SapC family protein [Betaproteobacteria bacterium]|nr:SapC family protein [Betaproteobacteria bacterium]